MWGFSLQIQWQLRGYNNWTQQTCKTHPTVSDSRSHFQNSQQNLFYMAHQQAFCPFLSKRKTFFPERRFVAGFFRRLLAYLTPHISHTYPAHHTYPTHIHSKRIPHISHTYPAHVHTYPTHVHSKRIPHISHTYPAHHTYPTHIHSKRIPHISHTYPASHTYPTHIQHPTHIHSERIPPIPIQGLHEYEYHCMSFHILLLGGNGNENRNFAFPPMSIIACHFIHCYSAGMVMKIETLLFLQLYGARMSMEFIVSYWPACLPVVCLCACFLIIFYYSIAPGGMGRVNRKATLSLKTIAQNCSETQISFNRGQPSR